ncbi:MAG: hypothetical protein HY898_10355 [Deltaproteobacteria bacterium]|nr:hypothetical protein [Deltaproteobacteria bacterium]
MADNNVAQRAGVYSTNLDGTAAVFTPVRTPAQGEVREIAQRIHGRVLRWMKRRAMLREDLDEARTDSKGQQPIDVMGCAPSTQPVPEPAPERRSRGRLQAATRYIPWADMLKRVHDIDALECPRCGGRLRMIALIMQRDVVHRILASLGLPCEPPVIARARAPTLFDDAPPPADYDAA